MKTQEILTEAVLLQHQSIALKITGRRTEIIVHKTIDALSITQVLAEVHLRFIVKQVRQVERTAAEHTDVLHQIGATIIHTDALRLQAEVTVARTGVLHQHLLELSIRINVLRQREAPTILLLAAHHQDVLRTAHQAEVLRQVALIIVLDTDDKSCVNKYGS